MTHFTTKNLKQTVVYWGNPVNDGLGAFTFDDPVEISARWEDRQQMFKNAQGQDELSKAVVYLGQDVQIGGYLYLGTLDDMSSSAPEPGDVTTALQIQGLTKVPGIKGTTYLRKVWVT
jgi:hypothetical protein